jgi:hypothetical protein
MAANGITAILQVLLEEVDRLEITQTQLDAANLAEVTDAEAADLVAARGAAQLLAAKLTKAASNTLLLCVRLDSALGMLNASSSPQRQKKSH